MDFIIKHEADLLTRYGAAAYKARYYLYDYKLIPPNREIVKFLDARVSEKSPEVVAANPTSVCFAQFRQMFTSFLGHNKRIPTRLLYVVDPNLHKHVQLSDDEIARWVTLCKEHGIMPKRIGPLFLRKKYFILDLQTINVNTMFLYLCAARLIQEEPYFIRGFFRCLDEGMDFYAAFVLASALLISNANHHVIGVARRFTGDAARVRFENGTILSEKINVNYARQLRLFLKYGSRLGPPPLKEMEKEENRVAAGECLNFSLHFKMNACGTLPELIAVPIMNLKTKEIIDTIYSGDEEMEKKIAEQPK